jgi:medium-chain acyl-[acyl-carrier-protein] hydrolase
MPRTNVVTLRAVPRPAVRLVCVPCAGGSASAFKPWTKLLPDSVECRAIQLPGRAERFTEPPFCTMTAIVQAVLDDVRTLRDRPFALLGHSMGGVIAFEVARALQAQDGVRPVHLFAAGRRPPHLPRLTGARADLPDDELVEALRPLGGLPDYVHKEPELLKVVLPILRADLRALETYEYAAGGPLDCDVSALGGLRDPEVTRADLEEWGRHTSGGFAVHMFAGDHFFVDTARRDVCAVVTRELDVSVARQRLASDSRNAAISSPLRTSRTSPTTTG